MSIGGKSTGSSAWHGQGGTPPLVLTLGSAAVRDAGRFYEHSLRAAGMLDRRAERLVGDEPRNRPPSLPFNSGCTGLSPFVAT